MHIAPVIFGHHPSHSCGHLPLLGLPMAIHLRHHCVWHRHHRRQVQSFFFFSRSLNGVSLGKFLDPSALHHLEGFAQLLRLNLQTVPQPPGLQAYTSTSLNSLQQCCTPTKCMHTCITLMQSLTISKHTELNYSLTTIAIKCSMHSVIAQICLLLALAQPLCCAHMKTHMGVHVHVGSMQL